MAVAGDQAYSLTLPMTDDPNEVRAALGGLTLQDGGDGPEAYGLAFHKAASDAAIGWRQDARHLIVSFGDSVPHDDNLNSGMASPKPILPDQKWSTAYAQAQAAATDTLDWQTVLAELRNSDEQITVLHVVSGSTDRENAPPQALLAYWKYWAGLTGGDAVLQEDAGQLPDTIRALVAQSGRHINALRLRTTGGYANWVKITPAQQSNLLVPDTGLAPQLPGRGCDPARPGREDPRRRLHPQDRCTGGWHPVQHVDADCHGSDQLRCSPCRLPPCTELPWNVLLWLIPLLLVLLGLLIWWLLQRLIYGDEWRERRKQNGWRCWLPCLLGLLLLLLLLFLLGSARPGASLLLPGRSHDGPGHRAGGFPDRHADPRHRASHAGRHGHPHAGPKLVGQPFGAHAGSHTGSRQRQPSRSCGRPYARSRPARGGRHDVGRGSDQPGHPARLRHPGAGPAVRCRPMAADHPGRLSAPLWPRAGS